MTKAAITPRITPDGPATGVRRDTDETDRSEMGRTDDPKLPGDGSESSYGNTDEQAPDRDGLVRGEDREQPLI